MRITLPLLLFAFVTLYSPFVGAQGLCNQGGGGFELDKSEGCAPLTVRITNTANSNFASYNAGYDGKSQAPTFQSIASYIYRNPGNFIMLQQAFLSSGKLGYACKTIKVSETRGIAANYSSCGGGKVIVSLTNNSILTAYDRIEIKWGDGETQNWQKGDNLVLEHNYANVSQSPTIVFTGYYSAGKACDKGVAASLPITFERPQLNEIQMSSVEMRGDGTLRVIYLGVAGIPTQVQFSTDGTSYTVHGGRSSGGTQPYDIKGLNTAQIYKIRLSSEDLCAGSTLTQPLSTMILSGSSTDGANTLKWNQYADATQFESYDLLRDGTVIKSFTNIGDLTYTDKDVECGSFSEYQVVARLKNATSTSAPVGVRVETGNPKPLTSGSVSVLDASSVTIKAEVPGAGPNASYQLSIERADAGSTVFKKIITLYNQNEFIDDAVKTSELSYCYRMSYENSCGQKVPASEPVCTILLNRNLTTLSWTAESPILGGFEGYTVMQTGSSGSSEDIPVQKNTSYTVKLNNQSDLEYNFQVKATSQNGGFESLSNVINYRRNAGVFVPDAFTPNGDGFNDILEAKSTQLQAFSFSVMNRWGIVVFHSDDIAKGWDGTFDGTNAPVGYYYYKMTFVDDIDQTVEKSGTFMLLR
ncbi:gliding motility-associated C-terminal domain-containing protein [Dyadobacter sp. CY261]|uniref:T9SS type B sorting domain-containing protein n=1 Tax=Dyadobacter sp. CY261 TaxID=2907203 RepID=UPI001F3FE57B|nr:gliding motility-associated C-terminal domain-containing protein [Dyadobacter sp. CY261]MCF0072503.1 gliding motility-associated C-terminal domain-containing protein [Dyadobacter sp. CY261]